MDSNYALLVVGLIVIGLMGIAVSMRNSTLNERIRGIRSIVKTEQLQGIVALALVREYRRDPDVSEDEVAAAVAHAVRQSIDPHLK